MPRAVPQSRNWGHRATGPAALGRGHRCLDLPGLVASFPKAWAPRPSPKSSPTLNPHLNPFLRFLAEGKSWQVIHGRLTVQPAWFREVSLNLRIH